MRTGGHTFLKQVQIAYKTQFLLDGWIAVRARKWTQNNSELGLRHSKRERDDGEGKEGQDLLRAVTSPHSPYRH
jgi:hypothetical protein